MFRSHWIIAVAFGLAIAGSLQAQEQTQDAGEAATNKSAPTEGQPLGIPVRIIEDRESAEARESRESEAEQREKDDLAAQQGMNAATQAMNEATQSMKHASWVSAGLVGFGTLLLVWTLYLTRDANRSAQDAVKITRDIGEAQIRAYVSISGVEVSLNKRSPSLRELFVNVGVVRTGQSPAHSVAVNIRPFEGMVLAQPEMRGKPVYEQMFGDISGDERPVIQSNIMVTEDFLGASKSRDGTDKFWCEIVIDLTYSDVFDHEITKSFKFYGWCSFAGGSPMMRAKKHDEWIEPKMWL